MKAKEKERRWKTFNSSRSASLLPFRSFSLYTRFRKGGFENIGATSVVSVSSRSVTASVSSVIQPAVFILEIGRGKSFATAHASSCTRRRRKTSQPFSYYSVLVYSYSAVYDRWFLNSALDCLLHIHMHSKTTWCICRIYTRCGRKKEMNKIFDNNNNKELVKSAIRRRISSKRGKKKNNNPISTAKG